LHRPATNTHNPATFAMSSVFAIPSIARGFGDSFDARPFHKSIPRPPARYSTTGPSSRGMIPPMRSILALHPSHRW
jgi:hypothetical protein